MQPALAAPDGEEPIGPLGRAFLQPVLRAVCVPDARVWASSTCAAGDAGSAPRLSALRRFVLRDAIGDARRIVADPGAACTDEMFARLLALRVAELLVESPKLADHRSELPTLTAPFAGRCGDERLLRAIDLGDQLLAKILEQRDRASRVQVAHTLLAVPEPAVERLLDALAVDTEDFADAAAASIRALTAAWAVGYLAIVASENAPPVEAPAVETPSVEVRRVEVPSPPPLPTPPVALTLPFLASFPDAVRAFNLADARPLVRLVRDLAPATPSWRALEVGAALASAKSDKDVTRIARELVVVLPPWTDPLTVEANASLPSLQSSDFRLNGDVTGGYAWTKFGFLVHASYLTYDVESVGSSGVVTLTQTDAAEARFDPWFHIPLGRSVTLEIRPTVAASVYDTQRLGATREPFRDQSSTMFRGAAIAGVRVVPHPRFGLAALAGGGAQVELFDGVRLVRSRVTLTDETASSGLVEGQLRMRYAVIPEWVSVRARGDLTYFRITRDDAVTTVARGTTLTTTSTSEYEQLEVVLRGFVDLDVLGFFMFRPSLHGGVNLVKVGDQTATVPVFGLGLRREAW